MTPEFCAWAAARLLEQLRAGGVPDPTPQHFAWDPMLDTIRAAVEPSDLALVRRLSADAHTVMWAAMLSRGFLDDAVLTDVLLDALARETNEERLVGLVHHLSARSLDDVQHEQVFGWVRMNPHSFIEDQKRAFGDVTGPQRLRARLTSKAPVFVAKRWLYMYSVHALDLTDARELLDEASRDVDERVAAAARHSRSLLG